jgi:hypothetical protein
MAASKNLESGPAPRLLPVLGLLYSGRPPGSVWAVPASLVRRGLPAVAEYGELGAQDLKTRQQMSRKILPLSGQFTTPEAVFSVTQWG